MALSIKTEEADRLARELSRLAGESMTAAITKVEWDEACGDTPEDPGT